MHFNSTVWTNVNTTYFLTVLDIFPWKFYHPQRVWIILNRNDFCLKPYERLMKDFRCTRLSTLKSYLQKFKFKKKQVY